MAERSMISQGFVQDAVASLTARGIDPGPVLARAGIAPDARGPPGGSGRQQTARDDNGHGRLP